MCENTCKKYIIKCDHRLSLYRILKKIFFTIYIFDHFGKSSSSYQATCRLKSSPNSEHLGRAWDTKSYG